MSVVDKGSALALGWLVFAPFWLSTVAALAWGRRALSGADIKRALLRTGAWSLVLLPAAWAGFSYCARFNPQPAMPPIWTGAFVAVLFLPFYSGLVACAVFESELQAAKRRGTPIRSLRVRILANTVIVAAAMGGVAALFVGAMIAAGPRALG